MRLKCPNCGAEYEVSEGMIPPAGRHVQCTACHTRWFVRGAPGGGMTEDQILRRLETWSPGPRPVPAPAAAGSAASAGPEPEPEPPAPVVVHLPPRPAAPAKPAERPAVARPAPLSAPARPQPAPRLDLGEPAPPPIATPAPARSRFVHGFLLGLVLAALALAAYLWREPIAARMPRAAPALAAYGEAVDHWRGEIERELDRFRSGADRG
ncbi:MAG TPA: zinc-ribbon domain-containing protein [Amaricoccus sp.]|nr:zinc-ribbon domain-containing protein [Amaricoccus sp.]